MTQLNKKVFYRMPFINCVFLIAFIFFSPALLATNCQTLSQQINEEQNRITRDNQQLNALEKSQQYNQTMSNRLKKTYKEYTNLETKIDLDYYNYIAQNLKKLIAKITQHRDNAQKRKQDFMKIHQEGCQQ